MHETLAIVASYLAVFLPALALLVAGLARLASRAPAADPPALLCSMKSINRRSR